MPYKDPEKQREYTRNWVKKRRKQWFKGKNCVKCGSTKTLELDHIEPDKKISHCVWSWSEKRRNKELKKCQVLCRDCHNEKTKVGNEYSHGTKHWSSRLNENDVKDIRKRIKSGETQRSIAENYGVHLSTINDINIGRSWNWL